jgi:hypothetical protein
MQTPVQTIESTAGKGEGVHHQILPGIRRAALEASGSECRVVTANSE